MTSQTVKLLAFLILLIHGIGHFQGVIAGLGVTLKKTLSPESWFFSPLLGKRITQTLCLFTFLVASATGIGAALSLNSWLLPHELWTPLAAISACGSVFALVFFWKGFAVMFNRIGAIIVNLLIIFSVILNFQWPASLFSN